MKPLRTLIPVILLLAAGFAFAAKSEPRSPVLPKQFAGWQRSGTSRVSQDVAAADPANTALMKEYGFDSLESATYVRDDGRKLTIKAARFADASGAYGAFTYYRMPEMLVEKIGDQGASLNQRVLFYRGNVLVDAVFEKLSAMSAAELRELSGLLPLPPGSAQGLAAFLTYMPRGPAGKVTTKYALGPVGLQKISSPLPAELVDFNAGAEVALGNYDKASDHASLMLISYPTPQIAAEHLRRIDAARQQNVQTPGSVPALATGPIFSKRTGPMVVVVTGQVSEGAAQSLLAAVNYDANVTWNHDDPWSKKNNIGTLVWNALLLCGILMVFALIFSLAFGGLRVLLPRFLRKKAADGSEQEEFISLQLEQGEPAPSNPKASSSIKAS